MNRGVPDLVWFSSLYDQFLANQNATFHNTAIKGQGESWLVADIVRTEKNFSSSGPLKRISGASIDSNF